MQNILSKNINNVHCYWTRPKRQKKITERWTTKAPLRGFFIQLFVNTTGGNDKDKGDVTETRNEEGTRAIKVPQCNTHYRWSCYIRHI